MSNRTISIDDLARLKHERDEANRRYVEALTALDGAKQAQPAEIPAPPPPPDEQQITPLNQSWDVLREPPVFEPGWRGRLAAIVWPVVRPFLERQQTFNSLLVDHVNRSLSVDRETQKSISSIIELARGQFHGLVTFEWLLMHFLQQLTGYIDGADRETAGILRRIVEDNREIIDRLVHRSEELAGDIRTVSDQIGASVSIAVTDLRQDFGGALSAVSDELLKRFESMSARERRIEGRVATVTDLQASISVLQQTTQTVRRELERLMTTGRPAAVTPTEAPERLAVSPGLPVAISSLNSFKYVGFEEQFRGSQDDIRGRLVEYVGLFEGASDVLDVGCGRGEFLDLLGKHGISGRGLDVNHEMVEVCRARGLDVAEGDALSYLSSLPDGSLGGLIAAQVAEHLQPDYLIQWLDVVYHKLRPGSRVVLETINPACWFAFFESYIRDITHVRPLHPDTLKYLLSASGFQRVRVEYRAPYPPYQKLQPLPQPRAVPASGAAEQARTREHEHLVETFNENVEKLNELLFTYLDYAAIAERL